MNLLNWTQPKDIFLVGIHVLDLTADPLTFQAPIDSTSSSSCSPSSSFSSTCPSTPALSSPIDDRLAHLEWQLNVTRFTVQKVITPALVCFGVIGNLVNIAVLTRRWMKSSTNCYLTALAVYDVLYLILSYILSLFHFQSVATSTWFNRYRMPVIRPLTDICSNTGIWLTLTFTVERYIGVCHPMKGKVWCTPRRAKVIVVVVCVSAALVTFPEFFEYTPSGENEEEAEKEDGRNSTGKGLPFSKTSFGDSPGYNVGYRYLNQALFTFLPLILLSIFNALLLNAVITAARWRQGVASADKPSCPSTTDATTNATTTPISRAGGGGGGGSNHQTQQRITVMLITVVVVFLVCQTPQAVQHVFTAYLILRSELTRERQILLTITANVFNLLVITNCCSNFVLYSSFSSKFRMTFHKLFLAPCTTRRKRASIEHLYSEAAGAAAAASTAPQPLNPTHPARTGGRRGNGHLAPTVVCTELWPSDVTNGQTTTANRVKTRVVKQLATEMVHLGSGATAEGSDEVTRSSENIQRLTKTDCISPPTFV